MNRKRNESEEELVRDNAFDLETEEPKQANYLQEFEIDPSLMTEMAEAAWDAY